MLSNSLSSEKIKKIKRIILCSGKIYFELRDHIETLHKENIHILRVEQLYPFPYDTLGEELSKFSDCEIVWCQEEPKNMGSWSFVRSRIKVVLKKIQSKQSKIPFIGRRSAASPATGVFDRHLANQQNILRLAIEADMKEIESEKEGVSLVKYKLPIE